MSLEGQLHSLISSFLSPLKLEENENESRSNPKLIPLIALHNISHKEVTGFHKKKEEKKEEDRGGGGQIAISLPTIQPFPLGSCLLPSLSPLLQALTTALETNYHHQQAEEEEEKGEEGGGRGTHLEIWLRCEIIQHILVGVDQSQLPFSSLDPILSSFLSSLSSIQTKLDDGIELEKVTIQEVEEEKVDKFQLMNLSRCPPPSTWSSRLLGSVSLFTENGAEVDIFLCLLRILINLTHHSFPLNNHLSSTSNLIPSSCDLLLSLLSSPLLLSSSSFYFDSSLLLLTLLSNFAETSFLPPPTSLSRLIPALSSLSAPVVDVASDGDEDGGELEGEGVERLVLSAHIALLIVCCLQNTQEEEEDSNSSIDIDDEMTSVMKRVLRGFVGLQEALNVLHLDTISPLVCAIQFLEEGEKEQKEDQTNDQEEDQIVESNGAMEVNEEGSQEIKGSWEWDGQNLIWVEEEEENQEPSCKDEE